MGSNKRSHSKSHANTRTRTTRSQKGRLVTEDPTTSTAALTTQLSSLGLYAAATLGDGNCLFRALSDQYYGSPSRHVEVRRDVCDWIAEHPERYEGFVDEDEFGSESNDRRKGKEGKLDVYLRRMRENATYGGHMELSAFAHLTQRNIKVIQPGLVYVIEWDPGHSSGKSKPRRKSRGKSSPAPSSSKLDDSEEESEEDIDENALEFAGLSKREKRSLIRDRKQEVQAKRQQKRHIDQDVDDDADQSDPDSDDEVPTIYVAYHDWEHFSSIRNLRGPHVGLPEIRESPSAPPLSSSSKPSSSRKSKSATPAPESDKAKEKKTVKIKLRVSEPSSSASSPKPSSKRSTPQDPTLIPLPLSGAATPRPTPSRSHSPSSRSTPSTSEPIDYSTLAPLPRTQRSPKRGFDESSASSEESTLSSGSKRQRTRAGSVSSPMDVDPPPVPQSQDLDDVDEEIVSEFSDSPLTSDVEDERGDAQMEPGEMKTPFLSPASSGTSSSSSSSLSPPPPPLSMTRTSMVQLDTGSPLSSLPSSPEPSPAPEKPLTRRERKKLGLPKPRAVLSSASGAQSAGKIVIPGGRFRRPGVPAPDVRVKQEEDVDEDEEWRTNGTGRVDVRGFRELKI